MAQVAAGGHVEDAAAHHAGEVAELGGALLTNLSTVIRGKPEALHLGVIALLSGGHLLVEDVPGVAKTLLAKAMAQSVGGSFRRVQGTPDLLPSDVTGVTVYSRATGAFEFRPGGIFVFDLNSLLTYRQLFTRDMATEVGDAFFCWRGEGDPDCKPGSVCAATIEAFASAHGPWWRRASSRHVQRHYPRSEVLEALHAAGLDCVALKGQSPGVRVSDEPDESLHTKLIYAAKRREV